MTCTTLRDNVEGSTSYPPETEVETMKQLRNRSVSEGETYTSNGGKHMLSESCARSVQYFAASAIVAMVVLISVADGREVNMTAVIYVHLLSFAAHFGAQCWVTFVAAYSTRRLCGVFVREQLLSGAQARRLDDPHVRAREGFRCGVRGRLL
ncbi:uncharacterized protein LOC127848446 [Dreissena polymorpha]|uniref:uncharacterized protein LOC127848446 n=1 Tax=Dreissena polymorpha TaxID=45954 RepID=UPI0022655E4C|nr:uncharacterized protein LOC127848446 [Dreissena polymorpha]